MTEAASNKEICSIKTVLSPCEHGYFFQKFSYTALEAVQIQTIRVQFYCVVRVTVLG